MRDVGLFTLKALHTAIWAVVEACVGYLLVTGAAGRTDRRTAWAAGVVGAETAVFLANGARCPLTALARRLGAEHAGVTDLFLPKVVARNLPILHVPLLAAVAVLHGRNLRRTRD